MQAGQLHVPIFALAEHALEIGVGQITRMSKNPEESALLRSHIIEIHVERRTIERLRRFQIDKAARQIAIEYARKGISPEDIIALIEDGIRYRNEIANRRSGPVKHSPNPVNNSQNQEPSGTGDSVDEENETRQGNSLGKLVDFLKGFAENQK